MAVTPKRLAVGSVPSTQTAAYITGGASKAIVKSMTFLNTDTASHTLDIFIFDQVTTIKLVSVTLGADDQFVFDTTFVLDGGYAIEIVADQAGIISYYISGAEVT